MATGVKAEIHIILISNLLNQKGALNEFSAPFTFSKRELGNYAFKKAVNFPEYVKCKLCIALVHAT